jgi:hypothetical protein
MTGFYAQYGPQMGMLLEFSTSIGCRLRQAPYSISFFSFMKFSEFQELTSLLSRLLFCSMSSRSEHVWHKI